MDNNSTKKSYVYLLINIAEVAWYYLLVLRSAMLHNQMQHNMQNQYLK